MDFFESSAAEILIKQLEAAAIPSLMIDAKGDIRYCNAAAQTLVPGFSRPGGLSSVISSAQLQKDLQRVQRGESFSFGTSPLEGASVVFRGTPLLDGNSPVGALVTFGPPADGSASFPELLGDVGAYSLEGCLRRILSEIFANLSVINRRMQAESNHSLDHYLSNLNRLSYRLLRNSSNMVAAMRFCSGENPQPVVTDFWAETAELLSACATLLRTTAVHLTYELPTESAYVLCHYPSVAIALLNVIVNAVRACGRSGTVKVVGKRLSGSVLLTISDDGCGISPQQIERIFTPYFTGFDDGKDAGAGLGLSVTRQIVDGCGGTITVHSEPGNGSTFAISFPLTDAPADPVLPLSSGAADYLRDRFSPLYLALCEIVSPPEP